MGVWWIDREYVQVGRALETWPRHRVHIVAEEPPDVAFYGRLAFSVEDDVGTTFASQTDCPDVRTNVWWQNAISRVWRFKHCVILPNAHPGVWEVHSWDYLTVMQAQSSNAQSLVMRLPRSRYQDVQIIILVMLLSATFWQIGSILAEFQEIEIRRKFGPP